MIEILFEKRIFNSLIDSENLNVQKYIAFYSGIQ